MTDNAETAREGIRAMLRMMGVNPEHPSVVETPDRWMRAYLELGISEDIPETILQKRFREEGVDSVVTVGPIQFVSICEHHLLPFTGEAWVAYKPEGGEVVGLSKIPRLVNYFARRPQLQERLGEQITGALMDNLKTAGAACVIRGQHSCMTMRGVRAVGAEMITSSLRGIFLEKGEARSEFLALAHGGPR